jgi:hypothetical protein
MLVGFSTLSPRGFTMQLRLPAALVIVALTAFAAACSGGGGGGTPMPTTTTTPSPTPTSSTSSQQVVRLALPTTAMGVENDPTFGLVGGFTQTGFSQVLGFAPGAQIMIQNAQSAGSAVQHTLGDTGGTSGFPASPPLSTTASGGSTFSSGFQTGTLNPGQIVGPITLTSGTYYIGCAFHYASNQMRDVLVVAAGAQPGPQATQPPGAATPPPIGGGGGY